MSGIMLPAPGTLAARDRGCTCESYRQRDGHRMVYTKDRCPLHGKIEHAPTDNGESRNASPIRLPGDAWGNR